VLLLAFPQPLSAQHTKQLLADVAAIEGQRVVDWDSQIVWSLRGETVESAATSRGGGRSPSVWVGAVRERIAKLGQVALSGRTFPIAPERAP
jgi:hypothetical protein